MKRDFISEPTKKKVPGKVIVCARCKKSGGTLVRVEDKYFHTYCNKICR